MTFSKIFSLIILSLFLFSGVAAVAVEADWGSDEAYSTSIENGDDATIYVSFSSRLTPFTATVELWDSNDEVIYTLLNSQLTTQAYHAAYTIDKSMYGNVGDFSVVVSADDGKAPNTDYITLTVTPDVTAPIITLNGNNPQSITRGSSYIEAGAIVSDNADGDLTSDLVIDSSEVRINNVGTYTVYYSVSDSAGNTATATRIVNVVPVGTDIIDPVVTISSPTSGSIYNSASRDLIFTATDDNLDSCSYSTDNGATIIPIECDSGELTTISLTASEGTNTWIVYAVDEAGNDASASVTFSVDTTVADTTAPVITIVSPEENDTIKSRSLDVEITTDENATVTLQLDDEDTVTMNNDEDHIFTYELSGLDNGEHTITFVATDTAGNIREEEVTFNVHKTSSKHSGIKVVVSESTDSEDEEDSTVFPTTGDVIILEEKTNQEVSFVQKIVNVIVDFFKKLFRLQ